MIRTATGLFCGAALLLGCGSSQPEALAPLDTSALVLHGGALYGANFGGDLMRIPTDGGTPAVFVADQPTSSLAADDTHLYWGNYYFSLNTSRTELMAAPFGGGDPVELAPGPVPMDVAVQGGFLYWGSNEQAEGESSDLKGTVRRVPVAGGAAEVIASGLDVTAVASDATGVYYADDEDVFNDTVVLLPGGNGAPQVLGTGLSGLGGVAHILPAGDQLVLVTSTGGGATVHALKALPKGGGDARTLSVGTDCPVIIGVAAEPPDVFVACQDTGSVSLERTGLDGSKSEVLATFPRPDAGTAVEPISNPVLDGPWVYVNAWGTLYRVAR